MTAPDVEPERVSPADLTAALKQYAAPLIADDLERSIANLGYPVGCGVAPHPDLCLRAAEAIIDRLGDAALRALAQTAQPRAGVE